MQSFPLSTKPETTKTRTEQKHKNVKYKNNYDDNYEKYKGTARPFLGK